jgi:hypothetical protein
VFYRSEISELGSKRTLKLARCGSGSFFAWTSTTTSGSVLAGVQPNLLNKNMTTAAASPPQDGRLTFPRDFPKAPPGGIVLITFKDFKERGIAMEPDANDNTVELDTLGIATVQMKEHATDRCKTKAKRQKREKEERQKYLDNNQEVPWWLDWAENEGRRIAKPTNA